MTRTYARRSGVAVDHLYGLSDDGRPYGHHSLSLCGAARLSGWSRESQPNLRRMCKRCELASSLPCRAGTLVVVDWDQSWDAALYEEARREASARAAQRRAVEWRRDLDARVAQHWAILDPILAGLDDDLERFDAESEYVAQIDDEWVRIEMHMHRIREWNEEARNERRERMPAAVLRRVEMCARAAQIACRLDEDDFEAWLALG